MSQPEISHLIESDLGRIAKTARPRRLAIDPWVASSLLQKAIRRGDVDVAERAAFTLARHRGQGTPQASSGPRSAASVAATWKP